MTPDTQAPAVIPSPSSPRRQSLTAKWDDHSTFTVEEFGEIFGLSRTAAYAATKGNTIAVVKIGRRIVIPRIAIERLLG